jgi:type II secretory pathway pseudopilin PulG
VKDMKTVNDQKGALLLELLFAFFILGFVVVSAGGLLIKTAQMSEDNKGRLLALQTAQSVLETIKDTALTGITTIPTTDLLPAGLNQGAVTIQTNPINVAGIDVATVTVTVSWRGANNRQQQLQISTMKSRF